jgi:hypothetical protein
MTVKVRRDGTRSRRRAKELGVVEVSAWPEQVLLTHVEPRGFGDSRYEIAIRPESFGRLTSAMMQANVDEAVKAFVAALREGVPNKKWKGCMVFECGGSVAPDGVIGRNAGIF